MRVCIVHPDETGRFDPPGVDAVRQIPGRVENPSEADVIIIPVARFDGFKFNPRLYDISKPWVLVDWCEFGWDDPLVRSYQWGVGRMHHPAFHNEEWRKFDQFVRDKPPIMQFQRELPQCFMHDTLQPMDYPWWTPDEGMQTKEEFLKRPLEVFYNWGRSSERRMWMQADIFLEAGKYGYDVVTQFDHIQKAIADNSQRKWAAIHAPHYARIEVKEVQQFNKLAKVQIIMGGAGRKTFRHGECCGDAIMAMEKDNLAWAYPWIDGQNCLQIAHDTDPIKKINDFLMQPDKCWDVYVQAVNNGRNYRPENYMRRHVYQKIESKI